MCKKKAINFNNICFISCNFKVAREYIINSIAKNKKQIVFHVNLNNYYHIQKKSLIENSIISRFIFLFEGIALKAGFFLLGKGWNIDTNGTDLYPLVFDCLNEEGKKVYLTGSDNVVIAKTVNILKSKYPKVDIVGCSDGFFDIDEEKTLCEKISLSNPDLLILSMGTPQEISFLNRNFDKLDVKSIWLTGGLFDFISGRFKRAPLIIRKLRLEWLFRFAKQPIQRIHRTFYQPIWLLFHLLFLALNRVK